MPNFRTQRPFTEIRARSLEAERNWKSQPPPSLRSIAQPHEIRGQVSGSRIRQRPPALVHAENAPSLSDRAGARERNERMAAVLPHAIQSPGEFAESAIWPACAARALVSFFT